MAAAVSRKSLPSLPPLLSASTCTMGKGRGEDSNLVLTPTVTSPMSPPLWPSLGSQLMAELSERLASGDGSACDGESENDEKLRMAACVGQMLLERHDKQEEKIQHLQSFIEETLEENKNLQVELQATKDSYRTLEAERDFLESSLAETESLSRAQSARRVSSEAREADLSRAMKELMSQCEEQQLELASLREVKQQVLSARRESEELRTVSTPKKRNSQQKLASPWNPSPDAMNSENDDDEDPWSVVAELRSRLSEQTRMSREREQVLRQELAEAEADRSGMQSKLDATRRAVRGVFKRPTSESEEIDGNTLQIEVQASSPLDDCAMQSLPPSSKSASFSRSRSLYSRTKPEVARRLFSESTATPDIPSPIAGNNASVWTEVAEQNEGLENRYQKLLRSFHSTPAEAAPEKDSTGGYTAMFEELFGMLRQLKTRLVTDLTATTDSPLSMSDDILVPM